MNGYITRIAPSPTGEMHIGTARTALFNYLAARSTGGKFILRIDDTDVERNREECTINILETMDKMELTPDEIYYQSKRTGFYVGMATSLVDAGYAIRLSNGAVALNWHADMPREWVDNIAGVIPITDTNIEQIDGRTILLKGGDSLGQPTYQLATVVDDYLMGINNIIRGTDHITNTAKQLALLWAMQTMNGEGYNPPIFNHVSLIYKDKKKLSKRDDAASVLTYLEEGVSVAAMWNFLLRLGWAPSMSAEVPLKDDKSTNIITQDKAIEWFCSSGRMKNSPANLDVQKLAFYKRKHAASTSKAV